MTPLIKDPAVTVVEPTVIGDATANLQNEYVPSSFGTIWPWDSEQKWLRSLPHPIDDLTREMGDQIYERDMPYDPQIYSTLLILVLAFIAENWQLGLPEISTDNPRFPLAVEILEFNKRNLNSLRRSFKSVLYEMISGMFSFGHKIAEQVYAYETWTPERGTQLVLRDIKTKPGTHYAFVMDPNFDEVGVLPLRPGFPSVMFPAVLIDSADRVIPRVKFFKLTWDSRNGDPSGRSHLRSVYTPWWKKQQITPQHLEFMGRFAQPSFYETLGPNVALKVDILDAKGNTLQQIDVIEKNNTELMKMKGGAVKTSPYGSQLEVVQAQGDGQVFMTAYDHEDKQIAKGVLLQTLSTEEGKYMARAASNTHQDMFGIFVAFGRDEVEWSATNDVLTPLTVYNYGEENRDLTPQLQLGDVQAQDIPTLINAIANFMGKGGIHESQLRAIYRLVNLPQPDPNADLAENLLQALKKPDVVQPPPPGDATKGAQQDGGN